MSRSSARPSPDPITRSTPSTGQATAGGPLATEQGEREFLHDLSTPLMVAMGHLRKLIDQRQENLSPEELERIHKIHRSIERIAELVQKRRQSIHASASSDPIFK